MQGIGGTVDQVPGFLKEDLRQFLVHVFIGVRQRWLLAIGFRGIFRLGFQAAIDLFQIPGELLLKRIRLIVCGRRGSEGVQLGNQIGVGLGGQSGRDLIHHVDQVFMACTHTVVERRIGNKIGV